VSERRYDAPSGEWRTFATHRQDRLFLPNPAECPLCPTRPGCPPTEIPVPHYDIAVFDNRFPSFTEHPPPPSVPGTALHPVTPTVGASEVVVWSDDHTLTLTDLPLARLARLMDVWAERYAELSAREEVAYVFIFENKGRVVGVTLDHPHGQIYAYPEVPPRSRHALEVARRYMRDHGRCLRCDTGADEAAGNRVVAENEHVIAYVPFAARFPYEVQIQPRRHATTLLDLADHERWALASVLHDVLVDYDNLFGFSLPYVLAMQQAPTDDGDWLEVSHLHIEITPLHRTSTKLKFLAGSELAAGAYINDVMPEDAANALRRARTTALAGPMAR